VQAACGSQNPSALQLGTRPSWLHKNPLRLGTPMPKFLGSGTVGIVPCQPNPEGVGSARAHVSPRSAPYCFGFGPECTPLYPVYPTTVPKSQSWAKSTVTRFLIQKRTRNRMKILKGEYQRNNKIVDEAPSKAVVCEMAMSYQFTVCKTCCCSSGLAKVYLDTALSPLGIKAREIRWLGQGMLEKESSVFNHEDVFQCKQWFTFMDTFIRAFSNLLRTGMVSGRLLRPGAAFSPECIHEAKLAQENGGDEFPSCVPVLPGTLNAQKCESAVTYLKTKWIPMGDQHNRQAPYCSKLLTRFKKEFGKGSSTYVAAVSCCKNPRPSEAVIREFLGRHAAESGCPLSHKLSESTVKLSKTGETACRYCNKAGKCCWNPIWCDRTWYQPKEEVECFNNNDRSNPGGDYV